VLQSHTGSQQWQSFEMRMRHRRVERCLLRASVAFEAGVLEEAITYLDEARQLEPHNPQVDELAARLTAAPPGPLAAPLFSPQPEPSSIFEVPNRPETSAISGSRRWVGVAAVMILMSGTAGWFWARTLFLRPDPVVATLGPPAQPEPSSDSQSVRISKATVEAPQTTPFVVTEAVNPGATGAGVAAGAAAVATTGSRVTEPDAGTPATLPLRTPESETPRSQPSDPTAGRLPLAPLPAPVPDPVPRAFTEVPVVSAAPPVAPAPALPDVAPASATPPGTGNLALAGTSVDLTASPAPVPAPAPIESTQARPSDDKTIRTVLGRYETAYNRLDATAATAVWPTADQRGLSNAFQGLSSQSVSLGRCEVRVGGVSAEAICNGTQRWTPKVGGGSQTAPRRWRFELRNTGDQWVISQVAVR
jgi:hypothetical protein